MINLVFMANEEKIFEGNVSKVQTSTPNGPVTILPEHQPYMSRIDGFVSYTPENGAPNIQNISRGFLYTNGKLCFIVADSII